MPDSLPPLPLLPTTVVGSHPRPAWWWLANEAIEQGRMGSRDIQETLDHAVDIAVLDQKRLGIDVITDGEMRRRRGFLHSLFARIPGFHYEPQTARYWGPPHYDMDHVLSVTERVSAPEGLGIAQDFAYLRARTHRRIKATCPGPLSFAYRCQLGGPYRDVWELAHDLAPIVNAELKACVAAGGDEAVGEPGLRLQPDALLDRPGQATRPRGGRRHRPPRADRRVIAGPSSVSGLGSAVERLYSVLEESERRAWLGRRADGGGGATRLASWRPGCWKPSMSACSVSTGTWRARAPRSSRG